MLLEMSVEFSGISRRLPGLGADELPGAFPALALQDRDLAIAAYDSADPDVRDGLDTLAVTMTIVLRRPARQWTTSTGGPRRSRPSPETPSLG